MGDVSHETEPSGHYPQEYSQDDSHLAASKPPSSSQPSQGSSHNPSGSAAFYSQYSALPAQQQRADLSKYPTQQAMNPYPLGAGHSQPGSSFNMNAIAGALPDYGSQSPAHFQSQMQQQGQRRLSGASTPAVVYQLQQNLQYPPQGGTNYGGPPYGGFAPGQFPGYAQTQGPQAGSYPQFGPGQQRMGTVPQQFSQYPQVSPQYYYFPGNYGPATQQAGQYQTQPSQMQIPYTGRAPAAAGSVSSTGLQSAEGGSGFTGPGESFAADDFRGIRREPSESNLSVPRGPPRKPKQSGHALWVGNLPPGATVIDLKDHFSRDATRDIESLFLISKSNCAFVNYRTEAACASAMQRFHDSRFHGVRLVCRLRRSSTASSGIPTGPSAMAGRRSSIASSPKSPTLDETTEDHEEIEQAVEDHLEGEPTGAAKVAEKFFIVKSLTLQDLEQSVRNGIWATQAHNEEALNKAYETADNVYLIFSANKSGEYFGYARMISPISADASEIYRAIPQTEPVESSDAPRTIPTPATEWAPKGRIIDDSARGTIFWEADLSDWEDDEGKVEEPTERAETDSASPQVWGKPFKVEWMSTNRLPFYRTRGLRNPWNANREVKIARDGTELETSVGKRLVQMFHRPGPAPASAQAILSPGQLPPTMGGPPMGFQ